MMTDQLHAPRAVTPEKEQEQEYLPGEAPVDRELPPHLAPAFRRFEAIIGSVLEEAPDASDLQFVGGDCMWVHANGSDRRSQVKIHDAEDILTWAKIFGRGGRGDEELRTGTKGAVENAVDVAGTRLRMTFRRQFGGHALNVRILAQDPPRLDSPRFERNPVPQALIDIVRNHTDGLVLVEGPTGSGKSTMLAALIAEVNATQHRHIYTLEDPIEFVHASNRSLVTQREVGTHVDSFLQGMKTAKRSKPGIILLGELRDKETMRAAVESAGEGHLVLATSHASAVPEAIATFIGSFPANEQGEIRQRLATTLRAVIVQKLIPTRDGKMVPAREMLKMLPPLAAKIREGGPADSIRTALQSSGNRDEPGIFSRDDDLFDLVAKRHVEPATALIHAHSAGELRTRITKLLSSR